MLTWKENTVFRFNAQLDLIETIPLFSGVREGWGITSIDNFLYISDGSEYLTKVDATSMETV